MRCPCDPGYHDPAPLAPRERVLAGLPERAEAYLADVGHAELAAAELRGRVSELEVLRDDLERRLVLERERAERAEGTLAAILRLAQPGATPADLAGLAAREAGG